MSENCEKCWSRFLKAEGEVLFCPQPKNIQFTEIREISDWSIIELFGK